MPHISSLSFTHHYKPPTFYKTPITNLIQTLLLLHIVNQTLLNKLKFISTKYQHVGPLSLYLPRPSLPYLHLFSLMYKGVDCSSFSILNHPTFFHIIRIIILLEVFDVSGHFYIIIIFIKIVPFKLIVLFMISNLIICLNGLIKCFIFLIFEFYRTKTFFFIVNEKYFEKVNWM